MKFLQKLRTNKHFWSVVIVLFFAVLASRTLLFQTGYFNMHDDLQMMRQLQLEKCFLDGQIPCRWVPDMGYGFGFPLFNFYPPLPYLIGEIFRLFGFAFTTTAKLTFASSIIVSGVGMYLLAKEFFGRLGGKLAAIFYIWAPYHAVDVYVRGAMNEAWALAWFPFIFWTAYRLVTSNKKRVVKWIVGLALSWFALLTSHNLMVLLFGPLFGVWVLLHLWRGKKWSRIPQLVKSGLLAFGLAAFFTVPALLENKFTQIESVLGGYYDYIAHFVDLNQIFVTRFWGYGPSVWGSVDDGMPFQIGHIHWVLALLLLGWVGVKIYEKRGKLAKFLKADLNVSVVGLLLVVGWFSAFMTHSRSTFIWKALPILKLVQFPWRFLAIVIFAFSFAIGVIPVLLNSLRGVKKSFGRLRMTATIFLSILIVAFNYNYFLPELGHMGPLTDDEKLSGVAWDLQQTAGIYDYLPKWAEQAPREPRSVLAEIMDGGGEIGGELSGTDWAEFNIVASEKAKVRINIFYFPGWKITLDGGEIGTYVDEQEKWGRMYIEVPEGEHLVRAELHDTVPRTAGNIISLVSWVGLLSYPVWRKRLSK